MFFELGAALADRKRIIPVLSRKLPPNRVPQVLRRFRFLEEPSATEAGKRVAEVIKTKTGSESDESRRSLRSSAVSTNLGYPPVWGGQTAPVSVSGTTTCFAAKC
jgi:hypothetical protein